MANKIQIRRDLAANWTNADPTLSQGELGYEIDTGKLKIGTGEHAWVDLNYFDDQNGSYNDLRDVPFSDPPHVSDIADAASEAYVDDAISALKAGASSALDTLNELAQALGNDANFAGTVATQLGLKANSADLSTVATSGNYADLLNKPTLFDGNYNSLTNKPTLFNGDYNNLSNKPTLFDGDYDSLSHKPTLFSGDYDDLTSKPTLFSGDYDDLTHKPTLFDGDYDSLTNKPTLFDGQYGSLTGKPNLAPVASSGDYEDLSGNPDVDKITLGDGTASNPSLVFGTDGAVDTGLFHPADGVVCVSSNGQENLRVDSGGARVNGFMKVAEVNGNLPNPPEAGMIVLDNGVFRGFTGSIWVNLH